MSTHAIGITFRTDWTIGTGRQSDAFVDQSVKVDATGLPIVSAEYFLGLWRDACEQVAMAFDNGDGVAGHPWSDAVARLFGREGRTGGGLIMANGDAELTWAGYLRSDDQLASMYRRRLIIHRHSTAVEDDRGVALDESLRVSEAVRAGTTLHVDVTLPDWKNRPWQVDFLLAAGLRNLHHLAAKRRRGGGRVTVSSPAWNVDSIVNARRGDLTTDIARTSAELAACDWPSSPMAAYLVGSPAAPYQQDHERWARRLVFRVTLGQPVLATKRLVGNTIESHGFLPGSYFVTPIARAIGGQAGPLIRDARFCVTPAHPDLGGMSFPSPRSWVAENKGQAWRETGKVDDAFTTTSPTVKSVSGWEANGVIGAPILTLSGHPNVDDEAQRPLEDGMFATQELSAEQSFVGEIWDDGSLAPHVDALLKLNGTQVRLGRGRKKRGLATVHVEKASVTQDAVVVIGAGERVPLRVLTDTVLLDDLGCPRPTAAELVAQLASAVGVGLTLVDARLGVTRTESWSVAHGLPRPSTIAVAGGSVVVVSPQAGLPRTDLDQALAAGIGELRVEGFGRLRVLDDAPPLTEHRQSVGVRRASAEPSDDAWTALRAAMWADELVERVGASDFSARVGATWFPAGLTPGQLRSLRGAARVAQRVGAVKPLRRWVERMGMGAVPRFRIGSEDELASAARMALGDPCPGDLGGLAPTQVVASAVVAYCRAGQRQNQAD